MIWLLRSLKTKQLILASVSLGVLTALCRDFSIMIPVVSSGVPFGELPFSSVIPLLVIVMVGSAQFAASPTVVGTAVRNHHGMLLLFAVAVGGLFTAAYLISSLLFSGLTPLDVTRNILGYMTLLILAQSAFGLKYAPIAPVLYLFLSTIFGRGENGDIQPWAWPVQPATPADVIAFLMVFLLVFIISYKKTFINSNNLKL
jgi:hypothetical protein